MSSSLRVRLFGRFEVRIDEEPVVGLRARDGARVLAYIASRVGEQVTYRALAEQFWPAEARASLDPLGGNFPSVRQAMRVVRLSLGTHSSALVSTAKGAVRLDPAAADVDIARFRDAIRTDDIYRWEEAAELALRGGILMEGWEDPWVLRERHRCEQSLFRVISRIIEHSLEAGDVTRAREWDERQKAHAERTGAAFEGVALRDAHPTPEMPRKPLQPAGAAIASEPDGAFYRHDPDGGAVPLDSPVYIERDVDARFHSAIRERHSVVLLKGARQMGKSSLLARGLHSARAHGSRIALTDLQSLHDADLRDPSALQIALGSSLSLQLGLDVIPADDWRSGLSANSNLELFVRRRALDPDDPPLVWALDEADRLIRSPFGTEVLGLLRSWHNQRSLHPDGPWARLTIVLAYATEAHLFIEDLNQSPFNVGTTIEMRDFTLEETMRLNHAYGGPVRTREEMNRLYGILGGHPYLTRRALELLAEPGETIDHVLNVAACADGPFGEHLRRMLLTLHREPRLEAILIALVKQGAPPDIESFYRLRSAGILVGPAASSAKLRCPLYEQFIGSQFV